MANLLHFIRHMYNTQAKIHLKWDMSENTQLLTNEIQRKPVLARSPSPTHIPAAAAPSSPPDGRDRGIFFGGFKVPSETEKQSHPRPHHIIHLYRYICRN